MKHNTHIYIARKAIDFLYDGLGNLYPESSISGHKETRKKARAVGKVLQRLLNNHKADVSEASWAPDDILRDNRLYHIFKLFTEEEFTDYADFFKETHTKQDINYYRASGGGGLPYRVEHLARGIRDMKKLRGYNDNYSVKQMMYQLLLLSHYVVDAHVPMHCDIRDDRPSAAKPSQGNYYKESWHAKIEKMWDDACTPVGIQEGCLERERAQDRLVDTALTPFVTFDLSNSNHIKEIQLEVIKILLFEEIYLAASACFSISFFLFTAWLSLEFSAANISSLAKASVIVAFLLKALS